MPYTQSAQPGGGEYGRRARRLHRQRVRRNRMIFGGACLLALALVFTGIWRLIKGGGEASPAPGAASSALVGPGQPGEAQPGDENEPAAPAAAGLDTKDWRMILVNNNLPLPDEYPVETQVADDNTGKELQTEAAQAYRRMDEAAAAEGVDLMLCSGYRSVEYQTGLFEKKKQEYRDKGLDEQQAYEQARTVVAVPGCSEHNSGLAADIVTPSHQNLDSAFDKTEAFDWLSLHAAEYGFILRYPEDKQAITGIIYEPWHYRYVGPENAAALNAAGLCLEEAHGLAAQAALAP